MQLLWIVLGVVAAALLLLFLITLVCFYITFYVPEKAKKSKEEFSIPKGEIYEPYRDQMVAWMKEACGMPHQEVSIRTFDGLTLRGKFYPYAPGAPIELMFHGYRGYAERDLCGGVQRCFALGRSALIVDQRAGGDSDGNIISFGVNESRDCLAWVDFIGRAFGTSRKIILTGISMGAATVMMAAGHPLPPSVIGVQADCGYTSARDIIRKVIRQIGLPAGLIYPFVKLAAKVFGRFDLEENPPCEALKKCRVPVLLLHGEADDYVPCEMSRINYEACAAPKKLFTVPGAGHGLAYLVDPEGYLNAFREFSELMGIPVTLKK